MNNETSTSTSTSKINVTAAQLEAALLFAGKKDIRYYLNGIFFKPAAGVIYATDGHRAIEIKTPGAAGPDEFIIPRESAEMALKIAKASKQKMVSVDYCADARTGRIGAAEFIAVDAKYPDAASVFPDAADAVLAAGMLNADYYWDACKAAALLECSPYPKALALPFSASVKPDPDDTPAEFIAKTAERVNFYYCDVCRIIVMPVRI